MRAARPENAITATASRRGQRLNDRGCAAPEGKRGTTVEAEHQVDRPQDMPGASAAEVVERPGLGPLVDGDDGPGNCPPAQWHAP